MANAALIAGLLALTAVRLVVAAVYPLVDDETYYWTWSRHLAWGYPDHPPMIAGLIRATTEIAGHSPIGVRLGPVLLALATTIVLYDLGRRLFGPRAGITAAVAYQIIPTAALGAVFAVPDAPFIFFWVLAVWFVWRARTSGKTADWIGAGCSLGLCFMSKLSAVFLGASLAGYFVFMSTDRHWLRRPGPYLGAAAALAVVSPLIVWNTRHGWITLEKLLNAVPWIDLKSPILNALAFIAAGLAYYGPLTWGLLLLSLGIILRTARRSDPRYALCAWVAAPIIALTTAASFDGLPKPHWPAPGYLVLLLPASALWLMVHTQPRWRRIAVGAVIINLVIIGATQLLPFVPTSPAARGLWGWDQLAKDVIPIVEETSQTPGRFILANSYQNAGQIDYYMRDRYPITTVGRDNTFGMRLPLQRLIDWNAVFVTDLAVGPGLPIARMFRRVEQLPDIEATLRGRVVKRFLVFRGFGFRGIPRTTIRPL